MFKNARKAVLALGLALALLAPTAAVAHAAPGAKDTRPAPSGEVGVLAGCIGGVICGRVINATSRGFYVTLQWGAPWSDDIIRWVGPGQSLGGNGIDVDGILVATGCLMSGVINGGPYNYPFAWTSGWHKISTNETALVTYYHC